MSKRYNASENIIGFDGKIVTMDGTSNGEQMNYGKAMIAGLMYPDPAVKLGLVDKLNRFGIAQRIASSLNDQTKVTLSEADAKTIIEACNPILTIYCLGKVSEFLAVGGEDQNG